MTSLRPERSGKPKLLNEPMVTATMRFVAKIYHYEDYRNLKEDPEIPHLKRHERLEAFRTLL